MLKMLTQRDVAAILMLTVKLVMLFNHLRSIKAQVVDCDNNPCFNGGSCMEGMEDMCQCLSSTFHTQPFCITSCLFRGCRNDGICMNGNCACPSNTAGPYCESVVDCNSNPCFNGGTCIRGNSHSCQCQSDFAQPFCTMSCEENGFSCRNGGTCLNGVCVCQTNFAGPYCENAFAVYLYPLSVTLQEGHSSNSRTNIQVCRQPSYVSSAVTVRTTSGSAGIEDYETITLMEVNIGAGIACVPTTVVATDDQLHEGTELFSFIISSVSSQAGVVQGHGTSTVTIMDNDPAPTITCPNDAVHYVQMGAGAMVSWTVPTVDNFIGDVSLSESHASGSIFTVGSTNVTITATDEVGNSVSCSFSVTVREDNEDPVINNCPHDITVGVEPGTLSIPLSWGSPMATDNLGSVTLTSAPQPGQTFFVGTETKVTYTATDAVGNEAQCVFTVTVLTVTIQCPGSMTVPAESALSFNNPSCVASETGMSSVSSSDCSPPAGSTIRVDKEITCTCSMYSSIRCTFMVFVTGAPVTIECPADPIELQRNSPLMYTSPRCRFRDNDTTFGSICSPQSFSTSVTSDIEVTCTCPQYQSVQCTFMVIVEAYIDCPVRSTTVYAGDRLSNPSCIFMGNSTPSTCTPSSGSRVFDETSVTCTCDDHPDLQCTFQVFTQMLCFQNQPCDDNCYCEAATCSDQPGNCSSDCRIFGCPFTLRSQSLSQVNPQSSVDIKCIVEASGSMPLIGLPFQTFVILSGAKDEIVAIGDDSGALSQFGTLIVESTATVHNVSEDDIFYCILAKNEYIIGSVNVTGFVYELPSILDPPSKVNRSTSSITISWRPWDPAVDMGDPPVVAYIPYYGMDPSQDWIHGSVIPANLLLEFTASNLVSDRNYTFSIATVREGEGGEGPRGPPVTIKTLCTVPPELLPSSVSTTLTASGDVSVSWKSPENVDCSTGITKFTVYYDVEGDTTTREEAGTTDGTTRSFIVDGSPLESGTTYYFYVTVTTDQEGAFSAITEDSQLIIGNEGSILPVIIGFLAFFIVILILILLIVVVIRKRRKNDSPDPNLPLNDIGGKSSVTGIDNHIYSNPPLSMHVDDDPQGDGGVYEDDNVVLEAEEPSKVDDIYGNLEPPAPIKISEFPEYIVNNSDNLEHEFLILNGANKIHPWTVAELPIHKRKNRFKNMYPYDHSRVVLNRLPDQDHSDYYNASYIVNERNEKTYIACQAPNKASIDDFWRMIFEQKVETIAMLTNLYEEGKDRCLRYWPNNESETESFGYINVTWEKTQPCANYDVRTLSVDRGGQIRQIEQLHFKAWPDKLIPDDAMSLVEFAKHCKLLHHGKSSPLLVHCSAGIGRSGTFIALYTMMDVLHTEEYIDVFSYVNKIREDRINMIQTKEQYGYLHTCLYEYYLTKDCQVSANALSHFKLQDSKASIVRQFELLSELETTGTGDSAQGSSSKNRKSTIRDRFGNMVPIMKNRVFLMSMSPSNPDNYINASFVKSFEKKDAFITTQSPLPNTIEDFWRMVYDHKCRTLVMLNQLDSSDKTCVQYWPDRGSLDYGIMTVTCIATEHQTDYTIRKFDVSINNSKEVLSVTHVQFTAWPPQCSAKSTINAFIDIEKIKQEENDTKPLVVHCINGFERSGVFVTVWSEMERIRATGKVDVFTTVKKLRSEHQHMLRKKMDYVLCFELLISYTQKFGNYENW